MSEKTARGIAGLFALLLTLAFFFLPMQNEGQAYNNSGRKKLELVSGEEYTWTWTPTMDVATRLEVALSGTKKAENVTVFAELRDAAGQTLASGSWTAGAQEDADSVVLDGRFVKGTDYTLAVRAEGEGAIKLKGEEQEETEAYYPMLSETAVYETRNSVLLYFAAGALLAALTPVFGKKAVRRARPKESLVGRALPWATFVLIAGMGIFITLVKPTFSIGEAWGSWDEEIHLGSVENMNLFREGGLRRAMAEVISWNPGYLPLAVGHNLASLFTSSRGDLYHVSVGFSAVSYALMCALAVRHAPRYKASFLVAGTLPTFLFLMTSMTYDTVVAGSILLGLALVLESTDREEPVSSFRAITMVSLLAFGTVAKPAYSLAVLSVFMIPYQRFGGRKQAWAFRGLAFLMMAWCFASMAMPGAYDSVIAGDSRFANTSVSGQLEDMLAHPLESGLRPARYVWEVREFLLKAGISHWAYVGNNDQFNGIYLWLLLVAAPLCTAGEQWGTKSPLTPGRRVGLAAVAIGAELVLAYGQYLASSEVGGAGGVAGMQARYFMPVWIAMALAIMWPHLIRKRIGKMGEWMTVGVFVFCLGVNLENAIIHMTRLGLL